MKAPRVDENLQRFKNGPLIAGPAIQNSLPDLFGDMSPLRAEGDDEVRQIWIRADRGSMEDYGTFEEFRDSSMVDTREEFEKYWQWEYPDPVKWYHVATARYREQRFFYINHELVLQYEPDPDNERIIEHIEDGLIQFLNWISGEIRREIALVKEDPVRYNRYLEEHLPHEKRKGKIRRSVFWDILGDEAIRLDQEIPSEVIRDLEELIPSVWDYDAVPGLTRVTAADFFRFCEICYQANGYFKDEEPRLSPLEQYLRMADGRHGGLTEIDMGSHDAFREWYKSGRSAGAHPWEVCRGGNSTHISLYLSERGDEWVVSLAGSSVVRVAETVRMASALYRERVPFHLRDAHSILRMIKGEDFIGIVPDHVFPCYCHGLFPKSDLIIDFMNLPHEDRDRVIAEASWYPIVQIEVV